ncbi:hypothetical protein ABIA70_001331 [Arthrobacter sp. 754]
MSNGQLLGDVASAGGADDGGPRHVEGVQDRGGVLGLFSQGIAALRFVRVALPAEIRRVDPEAGQQGIRRSKLPRDSPHA